MCSRHCLTVIDHDDLENNTIWVSCDASDFRTGAMLSFGPTFESARPVAFESAHLSGPELKFPVHEKELLAIVRALKKWRVDLLGVPFTVLTDHRTLENFHRQKDLSRRQARWQEFLSQYDFTIEYIRGEDNIVADALSRMRAASDASKVICDDTFSSIAAISTNLRISTDPSWLQAIRDGYQRDKWCLRLRENVGTLGIRETDGLLFVGNRLAIPRAPLVRESLFRCAHDALGHFGFEKSYAYLRDAYYWPNMRKELSTLYIPSCDDCQRNKATTSRPAGPLHPLPIPEARGEVVTIDFIGPLPPDSGFDAICTATDPLGADLRIWATRTDITAEEFAQDFFDNWYCENGLPLRIISDRDKLFTSAFWSALHKLTGVKLNLSSAFHPQTDGSSERTNKTVIQSLRYHVARNQRGWARALPRVRFAIMSATNASTNISRFQLHLGRQPRVLPPILDSEVATHAATTDEATLAADVLRRIDTDVLEAQDNLFAAKIAQMTAANRGRTEDPGFKVGDLVLLSTFHRRQAYMRRGDNRVAKFVVRYDGPYKVVRAFPETSTYTLDLPSSMKMFPTFHVSLLKRYLQNDDTQYPSRSFNPPSPIFTADGLEEQEVEAIIDHQRRGRGYRFLVHWKGFPSSHDSWLPGSECRDLAALDTYLDANPELRLDYPQTA